MVSWKFGGDASSATEGERVRLLDQSRVMGESIAALGDSRRVLEDTTQLGSNVMSKLLSQRETIIRSTQYAQETGSLQRETRNLLRAESRSDFYTKVVMYFTIVCLVIANILAILHRILK
ncbi:putative integral membrane protein [Babesia bovis T2Bo]|uniref:putative integral membrane protein n=1 Tax=Babesia bovis T2Bo TaxID=484906 RepID=UPI001C3494C2|nr:putative integral membrane protein [Babesia bovis T2Bo]KAG6440007.1 putative integral membrane protein [Babesia bovis T2Bo]